MWEEIFRYRSVVPRAGTLWALISSLWLALPAQQAHWRNLQRKYSPSIVLLVSGEHLERGLSSGFFISNKGQVATILPNLAKQQLLLARRADGSFLKTRVLKSDAQLRLGVLQASISSSAPLRLGDSNRVRVGDSVGVLGYTTGGRLEMRAGSVAQIQRMSNGVKIIHLSPSPEAFLSGAPVLNRKGEVIGIVARFTGKPFTGALPIGYLRTLSSSRPLSSASPAPHIAALPEAEQESPLWQKLQPIVQQARQIADLGVRAETLAVLARIAAQCGLVNKAQILFEEAASTTDKLEDVEERSFALKRICLQLMQVNQWERAVQLTHQIPDVLQRAAMLCELSRHAARSNQPEQAFAIGQQIDDPHYRCEALVAVAVAFYHQAQRDAPSSEAGSDEPVPSEGQPPAPSRCAELLQEAHRCAQQVTVERLQIASLATVAAGMLATGAIEMGNALLEEALRLAEQQDTLSAESARHDATMALLEYRQFDKASALLTQLPAARQDTARVKLTEVLIQAGQLDQVETCIEQIRDRQKQNRARLLLAQHLFLNHQYERARVCVESIPVSVERVYALTQLALAQSRAGQADMALQSLQTADENARRLNDSRQRPEGLAAVAAIHAQLGNPDRAESLFQDAINAAGALGEPWASTLRSRILLLKAETIRAGAEGLSSPTPLLSR